jgi:hypothetical protein
MKTLLTLTSLFALAAAFALSAAATTEPSSTLLEEIVVFPTHVTFGVYASTATHDGLIPFGGGHIPRGDFVNFKLINKGTQTARFAVFGRETQPVLPGKTGHFNVDALRRGRFPYSLSLSGGKTYRGVLIVT